MYLPGQFESQKLADAVELMRRHSFATLICNDDAGQPFLTHLPLHLELRELKGRQSLVLLGHVARANPHWRYLQQRGRASVSFLGPHAYMSPAVYPDAMRVPTWNYLAVECRAQARLRNDRADLDDMVEKLIADHEPGYLQQWRSLGEEYRTRMMRSIVGFELEVTELQCKLKLNQHRPESHAALREAFAAGGDMQRELLAWMDRLNM